MLLKALSNLLDVVTEYSSSRVREILSGLILLWRIDRCTDVEERARRPSLTGQEERRGCRRGSQLASIAAKVKRLGT